jgi:signal transduction histidine kinase
VYLHGALLLAVLFITIPTIGFFLGRDPRFRYQPLRTVERLVRLLETAPAQTLPALVTKVGEEMALDVAVYERDGRRVAAAGERPPRPLKPADVEKLLSGDGWRQDGHRATSGRIGADRYVRFRSRIGEHDLFWRAVVAMGVVVGVLALVSIPFARAIARPLEHLAGVARRWGAGDLQARARLDRGDEIGDLARAFDETAERVGRLLAGQRELLANVSHELRTPLARMRVSLALAAEAAPEDAPRHLADIESDAVDLEQLVTNVLTSSRLDAGGTLALQRASVDPATLVREALERFARFHPGRVVEQDVAPTPRVDVEAGLMARVLDNVLDNAAKYSEKDQPLGVSLGPAEGGVRIAVRDQGIGIAEEDHAAVFTPFFRSDRSRARDTGGAGLGLSLSKQIVDAHGGRITVDSRPGHGTVVAVWLPA